MQKTSIHKKYIVFTWENPLDYCGSQATPIWKPILENPLESPLDQWFPGLPNMVTHFRKKPRKPIRKPTRKPARPVVLGPPQYGDPF